MKISDFEAGYAIKYINNIGITLFLLSVIPFT